MEKIQSTIDRYQEGQISLVGVLQDVSSLFGYLPEETLRDIAREIDVPISTFYSLVTFYNSFRLEPIGKKHVCVCTGTACHVRGAERVLDTMERELDLEAGQTSDDLEFTLETVNCLGACALGPLVTVNGEYHGNIDQKKVHKLVRKIRKKTEDADSGVEA